VFEIPFIDAMPSIYTSRLRVPSSGGRSPWYRSTQIRSQTLQRKSSTITNSESSSVATSLDWNKKNSSESTDVVSIAESKNVHDVTQPERQATIITTSEEDWGYFVDCRGDSI
jgi:hypothetical protein